MQSVRGTYENGQLKLEKEFLSKKPVPVIITFLEKVEEEENEQPLTPLQSQEALIEKIREPFPKEPKIFRLENAHFEESQEALKHVKGSLSDLLIEERRSGR